MTARIGASHMTRILCIVCALLALGTGCTAKLCSGESALSCDDTNPCTDDTCVEGTGCVHTPNQASCSACGSDPCCSSACSAGSCVAKPYTPTCDGVCSGACDQARCPADCAPPKLEVCDNAQDDDGDGKADCLDSDCAAEPRCAPPKEVCDNTKDDDGDGKADCLDTDCASEPRCAPPAEVCDNLLDDDADGKADCQDPDCAAEPLCTPTPAETCGNNLDDDLDGRTDCEDGECAGLDPCIQLASPGDVVITEIMADPTAVADEAGEWLEVRNTTTEPIALNGWVLHDLDPTAPQWHVVRGPGRITVPAGGTLVLGALTDKSRNGGAQVDYAWATFGLDNDADEVVLEVKGERIDAVKYTTPGWPVVAGASLALDPGNQTAAGNDDPKAWCAATAKYNGQDHGTPGTTNASCP